MNRCFCGMRPTTKYRSRARLIFTCTQCAQNMRRLGIGSEVHDLDEFMQRLEKSAESGGKPPFEECPSVLRGVDSGAVTRQQVSRVNRTISGASTRFLRAKKSSQSPKGFEITRARAMLRKASNKRVLTRAQKRAGCYYCNLGATGIDHVVPKSLIRILLNSDSPYIYEVYKQHRNNLTVPSCLECNMILGNRYFDTLAARTEYVRSKRKL